MVFNDQFPPLELADQYFFDEWVAGLSSPGASTAVIDSHTSRPPATVSGYVVEQCFSRRQFASLCENLGSVKYAHLRVLTLQAVGLTDEAVALLARALPFTDLESVALPGLLELADCAG